MIKTSRLQTSIAAGATRVNVLADEDIEFLTAGSLVSFYVGQSATGLLVRAKANSIDLMDTASPNIVVAAGRLVDPDDRVIHEVVLAAGTRLKFLVDNPTAGALTVSTLVTVDEVPAGF